MGRDIWYFCSECLEDALIVLIDDQTATIICSGCKICMIISSREAVQYIKECDQKLDNLNA